MAQVPAVTLPVSNLLSLLNVVLNAQGCTGKQYDLTPRAGPAAGNVVEYYNAALDHYFITWVAAEQANLDAGKTPTRWMRTGRSFTSTRRRSRARRRCAATTFRPAFGDSHFFGRGTAECDATGAAHPTFVLEDPRFMYMFLPVRGVCPAGHDADLPRVQQPRRRQSSLHDGSRGARPDGRATAGSPKATDRTSS